jgi:hypothetical protein
MDMVMKTWRLHLSIQHGDKTVKSGCGVRPPSYATDATKYNVGEQVN